MSQFSHVRVSSKLVSFLLEAEEEDEEEMEKMQNGKDRGKGKKSCL